MESTGPVAAEWIRHVAEQIAAEVDELLPTVDEAIFKVAPVLADDPTLAAESRASSRANVVRWLTAMRVHPGEPLSRDAPPETLDLARTLIRRGVELQSLVQSYRTGVNVAWRRWMDVAAATIPSRGDLVDVLQASSTLMFAYVDGALDAVLTQMEQERGDLRSGAVAQRAETVRLLLDGAPISLERANRRLGYDLAARHTAAVLWAEPPGAGQGVLEQAAAVLAVAARARRPLTLPAGTSTLWAWIATHEEPDWAALRAALAEHAPPNVRVALGPPREGIAGFRRGHTAAVAAQRLLAGTPRSDQLTAYHEIEVVALAGRDQEQTQEFTAGALGPLAGAGAGLETLRDTVRVYLDEGGNAPRAARRLHTHRNTVLHRVARAEALLGHPVGERRLALALALELVHRLGDRALPPAPPSA
ncbi:helix-turn-helix domain-containing protein [Streptomyces sp. B1866]|uniref:PucR family transcriptional regulator n=1 Tax=Streptomyces sp. B1866 TaxID=3075431 RepID=UPI00288D61C5|nr:helix-turn-helix domain-containing protein [Streptomyces sp. B1866]MDT3397703.1 helix-turn-helix domain-containing protein [Streptomyces sp. B1866]